MPLVWLLLGRVHCARMRVGKARDSVVASRRTELKTRIAMFLRILIVVLPTCLRDRWNAELSGCVSGLFGVKDERTQGMCGIFLTALDTLDREKDIRAGELHMGLLRSRTVESFCGRT